MARPVLAIDFGGVCSVHAQHTDGEHVETRMNMPGCVETLRLLAQRFDLVLVSFCGRSRAVATKASVDATVPGLFRDLVFVRNKKDKGIICKTLGASALIDDRPDVLATLLPPCRPILFTTWAALSTLTLPYVPPSPPPANYASLVYSL